MRTYHDRISNYEQMRLSAPRFYDDVLEAQAIWRAQGHVLDVFGAEEQTELNNCLVPSANEEGIERFEQWFELSYTDGVSPDLWARRLLVRASFIGSKHIGKPEILAICESFAPGLPADVTFYHGLVTISIDGWIADVEGFAQMLERKLPAHLGRCIATKREFRHELDVGFGGGITRRWTGTPVSPRQTDRIDLHLSNAGIRISSLQGKPRRNPRHTERFAMNVGHAGWSAESMTGYPAADKRMESKPIEIRTGGAIHDALAGNGIVPHGKILEHKRITSGLVRAKEADNGGVI